ncbi:sulfite oxidase-like oxidoreductase [Bacillus sp. BGMRC 2118]|nr:sulfite oxidase-like oxidoreductase [Bacillus sp. BGMRC 2118]
MYFGKVKQKNTGDRVPPNQNVTTTFPVLHHGNVPYYQEDLSDWNLRIFGLVEKVITYSFSDIQKLADVSIQNDIHCVTGWSRLDNGWEGVSTKRIVNDAAVLPEAKFVVLHAEEGWTTNLPVQDFLKETSLLAFSHEGQPLTPEHGYPLRAVIPHLYFWKSAKWLRGIEFVKEDSAGFWEKNGYHMYGDPWKEERFSFD